MGEKEAAEEELAKIKTESESEIGNFKGHYDKAFGKGNTKPGREDERKQTLTVVYI